MSPNHEAPAAETWDLHPPTGGSPAEWLAWANDLPICQKLGLVCSELGDGQLTGIVQRPPLVANPNGSVHGGLQTAIADHCMGMAAVSILPAGLLVVTASVHASFHRPAMPPLTVRARVVSSGRTLVHVAVELLDDRDRLCCSAYGAMAVVASESVTRSGA